MSFVIEQAAAAQHVLPEVREIASDMVALRHQIHAHPELAYEEFVTSALVAQQLAA